MGDKIGEKYTVEEARQIIVRNCFGESLFMCPDGTLAWVTPCGYGELHKIEDCEWFLLNWDMPWGGDDKLEKIVEKLNNHAELKKQLDADRAQLRQFFDDHQGSGWDSDSWSFYSDWHKDLYGFRPHGKVCGKYVRPY